METVFFYSVFFFLQFPKKELNFASGQRIFWLANFLSIFQRLVQMIVFFPSNRNIFFSMKRFISACENGF